MRFPAKNCSICLKLFQIEAVISLPNFDNPSRSIFDMKISRKNPENTRKIEQIKYHDCFAWCRLSIGRRGDSVKCLGWNECVT